MPQPKNNPLFLPLAGDPIEEQHLEATLDFLAHIMITQGDVYAPVYDRLEAELVAIQKRSSSIDRARKRLASHTVEGDCREGQVIRAGRLRQAPHRHIGQILDENRSGMR